MSVMPYPEMDNAKIYTFFHCLIYFGLIFWNVRLDGKK